MKRHTLITIATLPMLAVVALWSGCSNGTTSPSATAAPAFAGQETFATPEEAAYTLIANARKGNVELMAPIFGPRITNMEAETKDRTNGDLQRLAAAYDRQHSLVKESDGSVTLLAGEKGWEFPAPIVQDSATGRWHFDSEAGAAEIRRRRIERNESDALDFLRDCIDSQRQFYAMSAARGERTPAYAARFISTPGKRDGLYWDDKMGSPRSPLGPTAAEAFESGRLQRGVAVQGYLGYTARILTRQVAAAPGGAKSYLDANGHLTEGFAFLAFPVEYGDTGNVSYLVTSDGRAYQKDLGPDTGNLAAAIEAFDPTGWEEIKAD